MSRFGTGTAGKKRRNEGAEGGGGEGVHERGRDGGRCGGEVGRRKSGGGYYVDVIQKRERMLHLLKRLPRKIAVSRMATSPVVLVLAPLPSATGPPGFYTAVIIIVSVPLQQAFELRRVYIQFPRIYTILPSYSLASLCVPFRFLSFSFFFFFFFFLPLPILTGRDILQ